MAKINKESTLYWTYLYLEYTLMSCSARKPCERMCCWKKCGAAFVTTETNTRCGSEFWLRSHFPASCSLYNLTCNKALDSLLWFCISFESLDPTCDTKWNNMKFKLVVFLFVCFWTNNWQFVNSKTSRWSIQNQGVAKMFWHLWKGPGIRNCSYKKCSLKFANS